MITPSVVVEWSFPHRPAAQEKVVIITNPVVERAEEVPK